MMQLLNGFIFMIYQKREFVTVVSRILLFVSSIKEVVAVKGSSSRHRWAEDFEIQFSSDCRAVGLSYSYRGR